MNLLAVSETDISPPEFRGHLVREALVNQLQRSPKKLTLIQAPPGYGKTGLLCQIYRMQPQTALWVNIRQSDNDPINLIQKIGAAIAALKSGDAVKSSQYQSDGFTPPSFNPWILSLIDELNEFNGVDIYLNDVDFLVEAPVLDILNRLIRNTSSDVRFYITTAKAASFSYAHLLMENQVASITQETLRFGKSEIIQVFKLAGATAPSASLLQKMVDLTEGWPAAIYFAAVNLEASSLESFLAELSHGQVAFDRYFVERVFERQSSGVQNLMLKLAMLDRFNIEICQLLSEGESETQQLISYIKNNTFISPIDASGTWFRFHQLFNIFLRKRCQFDLTLNEQNQARLQAAHWFKEIRNEEEAIGLALQAKAFDQAALWMEDAFPTVVVRYAKHVTYLDWFKTLPEEIVNQHPRVRIGYIWSLSAGRQFLAAAEQMSLLGRNKHAYSASVQKEIIRVVALANCAAKALKDEIKNLVPTVTQWLDEWNDDAHFKNINDYHYELGIAWLVKGFSEKCNSDFLQARAALNQAMEHFQAYGSYYGQCWARSLSAITYAKQGFHHEALKEAKEGYEQAQKQLGDKSHPGYGLAALISAINYEYDELELAEKYLEGALEYLKEQSSTDMLMAAYETKTRLFMHDGSVEEGIGFLKDGIKWAESQSLKRLYLKLADELVVWLLRHHRVAEAEQYSSQYDLILGDATGFQLERLEHKIAARSIVYMMLDKQDYSGALTVLSPLRERAERFGHLRRLAEWLKLEAMSYWLAGKKDQSKQSIIRALEISSSQNYYRLFLDDLGELSPILTHAEASSKGSSYHAFLAALSSKIAPTEETVANGVDALTAKETVIIKKLEQGSTNKDIAAELFISEGTLKWHLHNIYSKLQVKNRSTAVIVAREQGYL
ncbi:LuxR C-terminal-related transcriptional regulator [Alkalimarinus sediminis]|uniref:LuxR C-terminal-related transcriptional regulator n=1 Tax=Alkalimarinus sediminis TaxID=1632866 RepID=A0A9E8KP14_9ALTE|nr:LuxR C-terminal-related transcriptional regulator [Alkalimarinus sediminis]UZW74948.1 LuxR C-terminal-related transcriptional regulator [Alkalimarinus sediminis]